MTREGKSQVIDSLTAEFKSSLAVVVCDYRGLTHKELETLRKETKANNTKVRVAKNTLATVTIKDTELGDIELSGTNIFLWSDDQISARKVADKFASANKGKFVIKSGIIGGQISNASKVNVFARLPSREEPPEMFVSVWMGPVRNLTIGFDVLRRKKEEEAA